MADRGFSEQQRVGITGARNRMLARGAVRAAPPHPRSRLSADVADSSRRVTRVLRSLLLFSLALLWGPASFAQPCILLIGDSHLVDTMGTTLDAKLRQLPSSVVATYASCGSNPLWWVNGRRTTCGYWQRDRDGNEKRATTAPTPLMRTLLDELQPDFTVIAQGTNLLEGWPDGGEKASRALLAVVAAARTKCIWISPPNIRAVSEPQQTAYFEMIARVLPEYQCQLVDSRPFATYPPAPDGDGTHTTRQAMRGVRSRRSGRKALRRSLRG
jgi:hypothetical protein